MSRAGEVDSSHSMDRRQFLRRFEHAAVATMCSRGSLPLILTACGGARYVTASRIGGQLVLPLEELEPGGNALIEPPDGDLPIYIRRLGDGKYSAVLTRCMHKGCQVEPASDRFVCPCHGSEYSFEGAVLKGPTELPLVRYRVTSDQSRIYIHLEPPLTGASA